MRALTTGLVVMGLVLVCTQAIGAEEKTLTDWGLSPSSEWVFKTSEYVESGGGYTEDALNKTCICETYTVHTGMGIHAYREPDKVQWFMVIVLNPFGPNIVYEDYDYDGLFTCRN